MDTGRDLGSSMSKCHGVYKGQQFMDETEKWLISAICIIQSDDVQSSTGKESVYSNFGSNILGLVEMFQTGVKVNMEKECPTTERSETAIAFD